MVKTNISFFIPAYNCEDTINDAVNSIIETNFSDGDEIIIVNDASTDQTKQILHQIKQSYEFITILEHKRNKGGATTRNTAIENAKNDLLFCLDSDNILDKNSIYPLIKLLLDQNADAASFGEIWFFDKDINNITQKWVYKNDFYQIEDALAGPIFPGASGNYLFTKRSWEKAGFYPEFAGAVDTWGFGIRQLFTGTKMVILPESGYFHRLAQDSYWNRDSQNKNFYLNHLQILLPYLDQITDDDVEYIMGNPGRYEWMQNLSIHPLKFKSGKTGKTGYKVSFSTQTQSQTENNKSRPSHFYKIRFLIQKILKSGKKCLKNFYTNHSKEARFKEEFISFQQLSNQENRTDLTISWSDTYMIMNEKTANTKFDHHYVYHTAWAARKLMEYKPALHTDFSSCIRFNTIASAFIPIKFYDYRPAKITLSNFESEHVDLTHLPFPDNSISSLSCMHVIEHIGLGRYGDPLDPNGDIKAINELVRVLSIKGNLYVVFPVGKPRVCFNAHRIYDPCQIIEYFSKLKLHEFSVVDDTGEFHKEKNPEDYKTQNYACGMYHFIKE